MSTVTPSSIALLSFFTPDYQPLHNVNGPVKDEYCARHGYRHLVRAQPYRANPGYYAYDRLAYVRDLLFGDLPEGRGLEVILVMNGHAQVMTHSITVESFLEDGKDFYIAADVNGLNAGVFILRKSDWLRDWLDMLLSKEADYAHDSWHEQKCMQDHWERPEWKPRIKIVEQRLLNAYFFRHYNYLNRTPPVEGEFEKGVSAYVHVPGRSVFYPEPEPLVQTRVKIFSSPEVLDNIVR